MSLCYYNLDCVSNQLLRHSWKTLSTLLLWRLHTLVNVLLIIQIGTSAFHHKAITTTTCLPCHWLVCRLYFHMLPFLILDALLGLSVASSHRVSPFSWKLAYACYLCMDRDILCEFETTVPALSSTNPSSQDTCGHSGDLQRINNGSIDSLMQYTLEGVSSPTQLPSCTLTMLDAWYTCILVQQTLCVHVKTFSIARQPI